MDYQQLLEKYIAHIGRQEGIDYIEHEFPPDFITAEEWAELERLSETSRRFDG
jgi:hypothetical protein